jgi:hypothetical protein
MELEELSRDLDVAAAGMERVSRRLRMAGAGPAMFGGDRPGQLGALGRELARLEATAVSARAVEAARVAAVSGALADGVRQVLAAYRDVDSGSAAPR